MAERTEDKFANVSKQTLDITKINDVKEACKDCAAQWKNIGLGLGVEYHILESIEKTSETQEEKLQKVLSHWLRKNTPNSPDDPSYHKLCVVINKSGENRALAERIAIAHPASADKTESQQMSEFVTAERPPTSSAEKHVPREKPLKEAKTQSAPPSKLRQLLEKIKEFATKKPWQCCICTCTSAIILGVILVLIFFPITFAKYVKVPSQFETVPINDSIQNNHDRPVLVEPKTYKNTALIKLTLHSSIAPFKVFHVQCDQIITSLINTSLPTKPLEFLYPPWPVRNSYNYFGDETPINLANGSHLIYEVLANSSNSSSLQDNCLALYLFDSQMESEKFRNNITDAVYIDKSSCLSVGTPADPSLSKKTFNITRQASYYVYVQSPANIFFKANVSVVQYYYNTSGLSTCAVQRNSCTIELHSKFCYRPLKDVCLLVVSLNGDATITYQQETTLFVKNCHVMFVLACCMLGLLLLTLAIILCLCLLCQSSSSMPRSNERTDLLSIQRQSSPNMKRDRYD